MKKRTFVNPVFGDKVTLVKSSEETRGEYTLFEIEVAAGGGNTLHAHEAYSEKFTVLAGELTVRVAENFYTMTRQQCATFPPKTFHYFTNRSTAPARFLVALRPGQGGFEKSIAIAYGLAADGHASKRGIPKRLSFLAILVRLRGATPSAFASFLMPLFILSLRVQQKLKRC